MSNEVENRVVSLTFDNSAFGQKMNDTLSMLDKLKQGLNFKQGTQSMGELQSAASKFDMSPMGVSVESVGAKFAALATIGITALATLTSKAVDAGTKMIKALAIDPVLDGYKEYETNIGSIQTILANTQSKGTNLDQVNAALDQLNQYSDKTIYNFSQMAKNIGTFTAAGVDLDTSVSSIKGIANLAALSGSTSEQASTAMYQLSQAIASNRVALMDWNSVVNAGMGGEVFQKSLFETGKALGKFTDLPVGTTFEQWKEQAGGFRESIAGGDTWIDAEVLTTTLSAIAGDLDAAELSAKGFSDAQIVAIQQTADTATKAATEVKTVSQLFGTMKETIGSGWAETFRNVIGNFVEAKTLFTGLNNFFSGFINQSADARNELLAGWKAFGGRDAILGGLLNSLAALKALLTPIKEAFRSIFPPTTVTTLLELSARFRDFTASLIIGGETAAKIKSIFTGIFSIFKIGVEIIKGVYGVFKTLMGILFGFSDGALSVGAGVGDFISKIREMLVEGGGIARFFEIINSGVQKLGDFVASAREKIAGLFSGGVSKGGEEASGVISKFIDKLSGLSVIGDKAGSVLSSIGDAFKNGLGGVKNLLMTTWDAIASFFGGIGSKIAEVFNAGSFEPALKAINTGLLAGIAATFIAFFKKGFKLDFGQFGFLEQVSGIFEELGGTLKAFQLQVKADALLRIAAAVAVLTASVVVLSFIDSGKLAASMGALAVGFGQLVASMALLAKIEANPAKMVGLAASMILLAGAAGVLSLALKSLSTMSWGEMAKGLVGLLGGLQLLTMATQFFGANNASFIRSGLSLIVLSGGLWLFSKVIQTYANMTWQDLIHGLLGVGAALALFVGAINLLPDEGMAKVGLNFVIFAFGLQGIQKAIQSFASMPWNDMIKGFIGLGVALFGITAFLLALPADNLTQTGLGLILVAGSLWIMSKSIASMGNLDFGTLLKGLLGMGAALLLVVVAANAIQGAVAGAAAIVLMSGALYILGQTLATIADIGIGGILIGLLGIAGVLVVLGAAAAALVAFPPLLGALVGMGVALGIIGAGFALFGAGAYLTANALVALGGAGKKSIETLIEVLNAVIKSVPGFIQAFAEGIISLVKTLADAAPEIINAFGKIMTTLLDKIIEIMPKIGEAFGAIVVTASEAITENIDAIVATGAAVLLAFLDGIRDNISTITQLGIEILTNFVQSLADNVGILMAAASNLMVSFIQGLLAHALNMAQAGVDLLAQFINGIATNIQTVIDAATNLITTFISGIVGMYGNIAKAGADAIATFLMGIASNIGAVVTAATNMIISLVNGFASNALRLIAAGKDATLRFLEGLASNTIDFASKAADIIIRFINELSAVIDQKAPQIREAGKKLAFSIADGITGGLASKVKDVANSAKDLAGNAIDAAKGFLGINSPSKVFYEIGQGVAEGFVLALKRDKSVGIASESMAKGAVKSFNSVLNDVALSLEMMDEFNPTITPVLDLTGVSKDAKTLTDLMGASEMAASLAYRNASVIAASAAQSTSSPEEESAYSGPSSVTFEQNNYSPTALSTADVYRGTRSQIALAKKELAIP